MGLGVVLMEWSGVFKDVVELFIYTMFEWLFKIVINLY